MHKLGDIEMEENIARNIRESTISIDELLDIAKDHLKQGRIITPSDSNALTTYREILRREPDHPIAEAASQLITNKFLETEQVNQSLPGEDYISRDPRDELAESPDSPLQTYGESLALDESHGANVFVPRLQDEQSKRRIPIVVKTLLLCLALVVAAYLAYQYPHMPGRMEPDKVPDIPAKSDVGASNTITNANSRNINIKTVVALPEQTATTNSAALATDSDGLDRPDNIVLNAQGVNNNNEGGHKLADEMVDNYSEQTVANIEERPEVVIPIGQQETEDETITVVALGNKFKEEDKQVSDVENQIRLAERYLTEKRLTTPDGDNAIAQYKNVLLISPNNQTAIRGLEEAKIALIELFNEARVSQDWDLARTQLGILTEHFEASEVDVGELGQKLESGEIAYLLHRADVAFKNDQLTRPATNNASLLYAAVLSIDSNNITANRGVTNVVTRLIDLAEQAYRDGRLDAAKTHLRKVDKLQPDHPDAISLQSKIDEVIGVSSTAQTPPVTSMSNSDITSLLKEAELHVAALRLTTPPGNNAFDTYRRILDQFPNHHEATLGLEAVSTHLLKLADTAIRNREWAIAQGYIQQGTELNANKVEVNRVLGRLERERERNIEDRK